MGGGWVVGRGLSLQCVIFDPTFTCMQSNHMSRFSTQPQFVSSHKPIHPVRCNVEKQPYRHCLK